MPAELLNKYDSLSMLRFSTGVAPVARNDDAVPGDARGLGEARAASPTQPAEYIAMLRENGIFQANYFPVHDAEGGRGAVILDGTGSRTADDGDDGTADDRDPCL